MDQLGLKYRMHFRRNYLKRDMENSYIENDSPGKTKQPFAEIPDNVKRV